ncbi:hypothetical protein Tco_0645713 [Tanacetum coccineum]
MKNCLVALVNQSAGNSTYGNFELLICLEYRYEGPERTNLFEILWRVVLTKTGIFPVNTARQNLSSQAVSTSAARKVNTARPIVNEIRPRNNFYKSHSPIRRPSNRTTTPKANFSNPKVNTTEVKAVSVVGGKRETAVKPSAGCNWRPKRHYWNKVSKYNSGSSFSKNDNPQRALKNKGIVNSGCSRHMSGNKAYLVDYQDYNDGPVAFDGSCVGFYHHTTNGHQFTMPNRHQELASPEQTTSGKDLSNPLVINAPCYCNEALAIPGQTTTGKESSNPLMADSLPKTIQSNNPPLLRDYTLGSGEDSLELIELMAYCINLCEFVSKKNKEIM